MASFASAQPLWSYICTFSHSNSLDKCKLLTRKLEGSFSVRNSSFLGKTGKKAGMYPGCSMSVAASVGRIFVRLMNEF